MLLLRILIRNAFRHRLRTLLTILGITIALLSFGLLRTVVGAWYAGVNASSAGRLITRNAVSLIFPMPLSYGERIRQVEGVSGVSFANWFGGIYVSEKNFFPSFAVEPRSYLELYTEYLVAPAERRAFLSNRKGCLVGRKLAERFGWKIGDGITLKGTVYPGTWEFVLCGIYRGVDRSIDETQFFFHWDYLNETVKRVVPRRADQVGVFVMALDSPYRAAEISLAVDALFKNSPAETLTETEKAFQLGFVSMTEAIVVAIQIVSYVVIVIILAVVANTMAMTARERIGEYAIFKAMGFRSHHIVGMVVGESLLITMGGCLLGVSLTFPLAEAFGEYMGAFFPVFQVEASALYQEVACSVLIGVVAALFPAWRAVRINIADGLRRMG